MGTEQKTASQIIAICNQKGGVGKSVTTLNLGIGLARKGKKVLMLDVDAQGSLTASLGYSQPDQLNITLATILSRIITDEPLIPSYGVIHHETEQIDLIPSNIELSALEVILVNTMSRKTILRQYLSIRRKLIAKGIPAKEIAFIHDAKTDAQKAKLFADVRAGRVRVLLGSTRKMGAGTNAQTRLVASHDSDCPWRPSDLEQRMGRSIRQGNKNKTVRLFRYVTKGTFDAYNWALVESKQRFIRQIMTSKCPARSIEDVDATSLSYAEVKMLATGDPLIREKMSLDNEVKRLKIFKASHMSQKYELEDKVIKYYPQKIKETGLLIDCLKADLSVLQSHPAKEDAFAMTVMGKIHTERKAAGEAVIRACKSMAEPEKPVDLGEYRGFPMMLCFQDGEFLVKLKQNLSYTAVLNVDILGNITRMNNALEKIPENLIRQQQALATFQKELENAKQEAARPFSKETELQEKSARLLEVNAEFSRKEKEKGQQNISGTEKETEKPPSGNQ